MSTAAQTKPAAAFVGQNVRFDNPSGWGVGVVVAVAPQRQVAGHDGTQVVWTDSTTHVDAVVEWTNGSEAFATAPGTRRTVSVGHSMGGRAWPATWTADEA